MSQEFHYSAVSVGPLQQEGLASCVHVETCVCWKRELFQQIYGIQLILSTVALPCSTRQEGVSD